MGLGLGRAVVMGGPTFSWQNIETWMKGKSEVEVVDLVLKLREKLVSSLPCPGHRDTGPLSPDQCCPCRCGHRATSSL